MMAARWWRIASLRMRSLLRRRDVEAELDEELRYHVDELTAQHIARGLPPAQARTEALAAMGGLERRKEEARATRRVSRLENLARDARYTMRTLRRAPGFTVIVVATLAIGIGANTAIFTVVNGVLLRPLAYGDPAQLTVVQYRGQETVAPGAFLRWQSAADGVFERMGAAQRSSPTLTGRGNPEQVSALRLTADVLPMLRIHPMLGRVFLPDEARDGRDRVVVVSYGFWRRRLGSDSHAIGQSLMLDGASHTIVGVMPPGFAFAPFWATDAELWRPLVLDGMANDYDGASLRVFGRLKPGTTLVQARATMTLIGSEIKRTVPDYDADLTVIPLHDKVVGSVATTLWVLLAAVMLVLLIACANVAHLQLIRASGRERETALRLSLGASRGRLLQQALVESLTLAMFGAIAGLAIAVAGVRVLVALAPADIPRVDAIRLDPFVFAFMLVVAGLAGMISGALPALTGSRIDPNHVLKEAGRAASGGRRRGAASTLLVISEIAMAVVLLTGAGLVLRSFAAMVRVDPGFDPHNVLSMQIAVRGTQHDTLPRRGLFYADVTTKIAALPGVDAVSAVNHLPLHGDSWRFTFLIDGQPVPAPKDQPRALFRVVRPGYFRTMRIPIVGGRDVTTDDMQHRAHVVLFDQSAARRYWPGGDAVGQRIRIGDPAKDFEVFTVVGLVKNVEQPSWSGDPDGEMYFPYWDAPASEAATGFVSQLHPEYMTFVVRTHVAPMQLRAPIVSLMALLDPDAPVADILTLDQALAEQVSGPRFYLVLLGSFAAAALLLAGTGVYGVISYAVTMRTREIGIRLALGAAPGAPFMLVLHQGLRLALVGIGTGLLGALLLTRYLRSLLFEVGTLDPSTFIAVPLVLIGIAIAACAVPARRAANVEPMIALRSD